ncbi:MAG: hypothetical protein ACTTJZ_01340 [Sphaerochaetaceae bacterium]
MNKRSYPKPYKRGSFWYISFQRDGSSGSSALLPQMARGGERLCFKTELK